MIGYSFGENLFGAVLKKQNLDTIIADYGSTDSGPYKLGLGKTITSNEAYIKETLKFHSPLVTNAISRYCLALLEAMARMLMLTYSSTSGHGL